MTINENDSVLLKYPSEMSDYKNVLLIENNLKASEKFYDFANGETLPIIYSSKTQKTEILNMLKEKFTTINKLALAFTPNNGKDKLFLDSKSFFIEENINFFVSLIKIFNIKEVDFLPDNLGNYENWISFFEKIKTQTGVTINKLLLKEKNENKYFKLKFNYSSYLYDDIDPFVFLNTKPQYITSDGTYIYVTLKDTDRVVKVNLKNPSIIEDFIKLPTGFSPTGILIYKDFIFVASGSINFSCIGRFTYKNFGKNNYDYNFVRIDKPSIIEGMTIYNNNIYCSDIYNSRILYFGPFVGGVIGDNYLNGLITADKL